MTAEIINFGKVRAHELRGEENPLECCAWLVNKALEHILDSDQFTIEQPLRIKITTFRRQINFLSREKLQTKATKLALELNMDLNSFLRLGLGRERVDDIDYYREG